MGSQSKNNEENSSKTQNSNSCLREEQGDIWEDLFLIFGIQNCFWMVCVESCSVGSLCGQWRERLLQGVAGVDSEGRFSLTKRALSTAANGAWGEYSSVWFVAQIFVKACWLLSQHLEKPPSKFNWCSKKRFVCGTHACVCCPSSVKMSVHHLFLSCPLIPPKPHTPMLWVAAFSCLFWEVTLFNLFDSSEKKGFAVKGVIREVFVSC